MALSDESPQKREAAALQLWNGGKRAEPALQAALRSDDPEVAAQARLILEKIRFGLSPQSSAELFRLLGQYRGGSDPLRRAALDALTGQGAGGECAAHRPPCRSAHRPRA